MLRLLININYALALGSIFRLPGKMASRKTWISVLILVSISSSIPFTAATRHNVKTSADDTLEHADDRSFPARLAKRNVPYDVPGQNTDINQTVYVPMSMILGCTLYTLNPNTITKVKAKLGSGTKMIKFHIDVTGEDRKFPNRNETNVYRPFYWIRSTGRHGTGLLLLPPTYDVLSLTTLEFGVETMNVTLGENPTNCLDQMTHTDMEALLRELVMNDFQNTSTGDVAHMKPLESVCNLHVLDADGTAMFHYYCCHRGEDLLITCKYLKSDIWLEILFVAITFLKVLVFLYSPRFIPDSMYRLKNIAMPYIHKLDPVNPLKFNLVVTRNPTKHTNVRTKFKLKDFSEMPNFSTKLQTLELDQPFRVTLEQLSFRIKHARLLPEDYAPVSLLTTLYETCFKCKIRERSSVKECCDTDFFQHCNCTTKVCPWYVLLKGFMKVVMVIILALPWILRVYVYFKFEEQEMTARKTEANYRELKFYFPGNYTVYLTPLHLLFVVIYALLTIESITYGVMARRTKEKFKLVLRKCFRDMREVSKIEIIGMLVKNLVKPCQKFGGFGICVAPILWAFGLPVLAVTFSIFMFPTINITFRLMGHFMLFIIPKECCGLTRHCPKIVSYLKRMESNLEMETLMPQLNIDKTEQMKQVNTSCKRFTQLVIITLCLISLYSVIFLITEFVSFLVEVFVFTLMGLILNADSLLTYFSLLFLLAVYGNDCFGHVTQVFLAFNRTMHAVALKLGKDKVKDIIYEPKDIQRNRAFRIRTDRTSGAEKPTIVKNAEGLPRWSVSRLILFLSQSDKPLIPKSFYFEACKMNYYSVPGELLIAYLRAGLEFGVIIMFLVFVLIVVLAFGDTYEISASNQLLATVAGGILPFLLRKIVFKAHAVADTDTSSIHFDVCLNQLIDEYKEAWPIYDINIVAAEKISTGLAAESHVETASMEVMEEKEAIEMTEMGDTTNKPSEESAADTKDVDKELPVQLVLETEQLLEREETDLYIETDDKVIDVLIDISKGEFEYIATV